jgi:hypothetical protein
VGIKLEPRVKEDQDYKPKRYMQHTDTLHVKTQHSHNSFVECREYRCRSCICLNDFRQSEERKGGRGLSRCFGIERESRTEERSHFELLNFNVNLLLSHCDQSSRLAAASSRSKHPTKRQCSNENRNLIQPPSVCPTLLYFSSLAL